MAGGEDEKRYPWGEGGEVRYHANTAESNLKRTTPVCMYPLGASPLGVIDMGGNVWEWQANLYEKGQPYRALRGGSWINNKTNARVAVRNNNHPNNDWNNNGFRVGAFHDFHFASSASLRMHSVAEAKTGAACPGLL